MDRNSSEEELREDVQLRAYKERRMKWYRQRYRTTLLVSANSDEPTKIVYTNEYHVPPKERSVEPESSEEDSFETMSNHTNETFSQPNPKNEDGIS